MWPALLQEELGRSFEVRNFGASGVPVQRYHEWGPLNEVLALKPDGVVVMLGTNDAWMWNEYWFKEKYTSLLTAPVTRPTNVDAPASPSPSLTLPQPPPSWPLGSV